MTRTLDRVEPVLVKVERGVILWRWGRAWCTGAKVHLLPHDAARLERDGAVERLR